MKRSLWMGTLFLAGAGALTAQQVSQDKYQGTSNPPPDDTITTYQEAPAKPAPGKPMAAPTAPAQEAAPAVQPQPAAADSMSSNVRSAQSARTDGTDDGIVMLAPDTGSDPRLSRRGPAADPDGDIVHPDPPPPGTLAYGTTIRARLKERLSTAYTEEGESFHATVASDVLQGGQILIPTGSEIEGTVAEVSTGHFAGHGSMVLRPQIVTLPDGSKFHLYAQVASTPGTNARVGSEGAINPGSRIKKDGIEYGGGVGVGMIAGGAIAGPVGVLAGSIVGASAVTVHLMMDHPQANLEKGSVLVFSLTQPLHLTTMADSLVENGQSAAPQVAVQ